MNRFPIAFAQAVTFSLILTAGLTTLGFAQDPEGTRLTTQPGSQYAPLVLPSGSIVYSDSESLRVWVSLGRLDPWSFRYPGRPRFWTQRVFQGSASAGPPRAVDYLENSVLVVWSDDRNGTGNADLFVQRIGAGVWPSFIWDGIPVCNADSAQTDPAVVDDGAGGFYVAWADSRNAGGDTDVYLQRFHEYGQIWEGWPVNGLLVCSAAGNQGEPALFPDGTGGAVVIWRDGRSGDSDLYAKGFDPGGTVAAGWSADGLAVCAAPNEQHGHVALPDGSGGAYVAWEDERDLAALPYATRIRGNGQIAPGWAANGTLASTNASQSAEAIALCAADSGGVFLAWNWSSESGTGVSVQHLGPDGSVEWSDPGISVGSGAAAGSAPAVMPDGVGGAFVTWSAEAGGSVDLRAARVDRSGNFSQFWPFDGVTVCAAVGDQILPGWRSGGSPTGPIYPSPGGGFIVIWTDTRNPSDVDLYAQHVSKNGVIAPTFPTFCFEYCGPPDYIRRVYPNPTRGDVVLRAWVPEDRAVLVDVYDVRGVLRGTQRITNLPGGADMDIPVAVRGLPTGVYFVRYRLEGPTSGASYGSRRVVLIH